MSKRTTVFISFSHDSADHEDRVRGLGASLSRDGCECRLDFYKDTGEDWPTWMTRQLIEADYVLCVVTETYERRFRDQELPDQGQGVGWEAGLIRRLLYSKKLHNDRIFPVVFAESDRKHIPLELQGYDFFRLDDVSSGYESLLRKVLQKRRYSPPETGTPPTLATTQAAPLFPRPFAPAVTTACDVESTDISRILKYAPDELIGREVEMDVLNAAWDQAIAGSAQRPRVLTFVALGGEGKTSLVAKWAADLAHRDWPGCEAVFAWSFYSQGSREQAAVSSDVFLAEALAFFGDSEMANSSKGAFEKAKRLAQLVGERRVVLILDGLEPLQYLPGPPMQSKLKDEALAVLLKELATRSKGLCVVTTRYSIPDLKTYWQTTAPERRLVRLSTTAGAALLKSLDVHGTEAEFEQLVEDVRGHALTLNLLGSYLRDAHGGDIRRRDLVKLEDADLEEQGGHAFRVLDAYVKSFEEEGQIEQKAARGTKKTNTESCSSTLGTGASQSDFGASAAVCPSSAPRSSRGQQAIALLSLLGLFDRPASVDCLQVLWSGEPIVGLTEPLVGLSEVQRNLALKRLEDARLLTVNRKGSGALVSLDTHPLIREYFAKRLRARTGQPLSALGKAQGSMVNHLPGALKPRYLGLKTLWRLVLLAR